MSEATDLIEKGWVLKGEIKRLKEINAELLAACQASLTVEFMSGFNAINQNEVRNKIKAAIAKATPQEDTK